MPYLITVYETFCKDNIFIWILVGFIKKIIEMMIDFL